MKRVERDAQWLRAVQRALLDFFDQRRRDLPWRRNADPYRVWISEIMLQQTRVRAVLPYYERWLARFPTLDSLAAADLDDVLLAWQGLGYYSRARNLHRAARVVRDRFDGRFPRTMHTLRELPGIGPYTAGAIASIAFGQAQPAIDGNVRRVLARLLDETDPSPARLHDVANALMPADRPGDFNQAFMELGATVCAPRSPSCGLCPLRPHCLAYAAGTTDLRPARRPKKPVPSFDIGTAVLLDPSGRLLVQRRPPASLLAGLWSFPAAVVRHAETPRRAAARAARSLGVTGDARRATTIAVVPHLFSHRRETYHAFAFRISSRPDRSNRGHSDPVTSANADLRWASPAELESLAMPTAQREILRALISGGWPPLE